MTSPDTQDDVSCDSYNKKYKYSGISNRDAKGGKKKVKYDDEPSTPCKSATGGGQGSRGSKGKGGSQVNQGVKKIIFFCKC